jgi:hypothetical protein
MWRAQASDSSDAYAAPSQAYASEQSVATIVPGTDHDHHVTPVATTGARPQQLGGARGYASRGTLHQRVDAFNGDRPVLDAADLVHAVGAHDHASQITTAEAIPASWDMLR